MAYVAPRSRCRSRPESISGAPHPDRKIGNFRRGHTSFDVPSMNHTRTGSETRFQDPYPDQHIGNPPQRPSRSTTDLEASTSTRPCTNFKVSSTGNPSQEPYIPNSNSDLGPKIRGPAHRAPFVRRGHKNKESRNTQESRQNERKPSQSLNRRPHVFARYAGLGIRRAIVASSDPGVSWSTTLLGFQPFSLSSLAHLSGESLNTLAIALVPPNCRERDAELCSQSEKMVGAGSDGDLDTSPYPGALQLSASQVADTVVDNLYADISGALYNVNSFLESRFWDGLNPKLWMRFGRILFHSRYNGSDLTEYAPFEANSLARFLYGNKGQVGSVMKTFDSGLSEEFFNKLKVSTCGHGKKFPTPTEKFIIQIADATQPQIILVCTCKQNLVGDRTRLTLSKVRVNPVRHLVADVVCMGKEVDLRVILTTRELYKGKWDGLKPIIDKAVYNAKAEGGLHWPLGSTSSGPYSVVGVDKVSQVNISGHNRKWKFRYANRKSNDDLVGRLSYEADVAAEEWKYNFRMWNEIYRQGIHTQNCLWSDDQLEPFTKLFAWVWENCI